VRSPSDSTSLQSSSRLGDTSTLVVLLIAAGVTEGVLLWLTSLMSLPNFFPADNPGKEQVSLDFNMMLGSNWLHNTVLQTAAFAVLFLAFLLSLWLLYRARPSRFLLLLIFLAPVIWMITTAFMYPPYARDLFHNLADARLIWLYHLNPMVVAPSARPFPIGTSFIDVPNPYGPLSYLLSFPGAVFQPDNYLSSIVLLKLWTGMFYLATGALVYLILRTESDRLAILGAALYLWNPFVIVRDLGDAHNDVMMMFFVLLALYFARRSRWDLVLPALALSALIKWITLLLGPVFLAYVLYLPGQDRRRALREFLLGAVLAVGLAVVILLPFWQGRHTFDALIASTHLSATSTPHVLEFLVTGSVLPTSFAQTSRTIMLFVFLVPFVWLLVRVRPPDWHLHAAVYQALLLYIFIAVAWFRPWYFLWVLTAGALLPWGWFLAVSLTLSWFGMFPEIVDQYSNMVPWVGASDGRMMMATILVTFLVPALVWLAGFACTRSWFFQRPHTALQPPTE
jgi:hypothetical protein